MRAASEVPPYPYDFINSNNFYLYLLSIKVEGDSMGTGGQVAPNVGQCVCQCVNLEDSEGHA